MQLLSGRYLVGESLYGDGAVSVHRGHDQVLNRTVMIELLRPGLPNDDAADALRAMARQMAVTELPHVAALYDQGEQDGRPYLVLEEPLGRPLGEAAPLAPAHVVGLISALATTLRAARTKGAKPPRLDAESVRVTDDGRVQIVDWGARLDTPGTLDDEVTVVAPLLALAATGSASGQTNRAVPAPLMRVVERTLAGQYASVDAVENELRRTATTANAPTAAIPRARPTVIIPDQPAQPQTGPPAPYPAPHRRSRRSLLLPGAALLLLVGLLVGGALLRNRLPAAGTAANTTVDATPSVVAPASNAAATAAPGQGRPYVVAARGARTLVVRSGPGTRSARVGALPNGTPVRVVGEPVAADGYRWVQIESDTLNGWCILEGLRQR